jgi:dTDP-4-dehydrorhamnose reductase
MKILLLGKNGQIGFELNKRLHVLGDVIATDRSQLDLSKPDQIRSFIDQLNPDMIINTAGYTAVDQAESEPALVFQINAIAPQVLAEKAAQLDIPLVHFSTDYVFDGFKKGYYFEDDIPNPQSTYAKTKWEGEEAIRQHKKHIIVRASWVFGPHGHNFLKTILRLVQEKDSLTIVNDQWGSPASASMLGDVTLHIANIILNHKAFPNYGTYHLTCEGETNWYQYATFITEEAIQLGLKVTCDPQHIHPISTSQYPMAAKRPLNSRLSTHKLRKVFMLELPRWQDEVKQVLRTLVH